MKNTSTAHESTWRAQLGSFDSYLKARGMAEKTRTAYGTDMEQLAEWAAAQGLDPFTLDQRMLRRYAGVISERGLSKSSVARKIASIRAFYRHLVPRALLAATPTTAPLELRDRALFEVAYGCGLRAEELVNLDVQDLDPDAEEMRVT